MTAVTRKSAYILYYFHGEVILRGKPFWGNYLAQAQYNNNNL